MHGIGYFRKPPFKNEAPPEALLPIIQKLKTLSDKESALREAYAYLTSTHRGYRVRTYTKIHNLFDFDLHKLAAGGIFLHCTKLNYLLRYLLLQSGHFSEGDIKLKHALVGYISPHQYVEVKVGEDKFINVDIWGQAYGIKFGDYAHGFNSKLRSIHRKQSRNKS